MIRWLMLGLLLLFNESACEKTGSRGAAAVAAAANLEANIKATASTDHQDVYRLTCYTCVNVSDNKMCNEWAIDAPCPSGARDFCRSLHIVDSRGQSVLVNKSCASRAECSPASVGCMPIDTQKICISCCDTSYCNVDSPSDASNATYSRKRAWPSVDEGAGGEGRGPSGESGVRGKPSTSPLLLLPLLCVLALLP